MNHQKLEKTQSICLGECFFVNTLGPKWKFMILRLERVIMYKFKVVGTIDRVMIIFPGVLLKDNNEFDDKGAI